MTSRFAVLSTLAALAGTGCLVAAGQPEPLVATHPGTGQATVVVASNGPTAGPVAQGGGGGAVEANRGGAPSGGGGATAGGAIQVGDGLWVRLGALPAGVTAMPATCGNAAAETCNNAFDDDCDGQIDEGCAIEHGEHAARHSTTVQGGPFQVAVAWNSTTDVNLYVAGHDGEELNVVEGATTYGGGQYQVELHGACDYDFSVDRPMENVRWTRRPPLGTYRVRVQSDFMCDAPRARTTLSISVGGRVVGAYQFVLAERSQSVTFELTLDDQPS